MCERVREEGWFFPRLLLGQGKGTLPNVFLSREARVPILEGVMVRRGERPPEAVAILALLPAAVTDALL